MHVLKARQTGIYTAYYVGMSEEDIGGRWYDHINEFQNPDEEYWVPRSADEFLDDPVEVINKGYEGWAQEQDNKEERKRIMRQILEATWFCYAEIDGNSGDELEHLEYVVQEGLKEYLGITEDEWIGDAPNRPKPERSIEIVNDFAQGFLEGTLPPTIRYIKESEEIEIEIE